MATSCEKDSVHNPKQKIDRIFYSEVEISGGNTCRVVSKYLSQDWTWDKNVLKSIDYFWPDGMFYYTENFTYDEQNRMSEVARSCDSYRMLFGYENGQLAQIVCYVDTVVHQTFEFSYEGNKLVEMKTYWENMFDVKPSMNVLKLIVPNFSERAFEKKMAKLKEVCNSKGNSVTTDKYEWKGNNISKVVETIDGVLYDESSTCEFFYDNKVNPFRNFFDFAPIKTWSANNLIKEVDEKGGETIFTYTYKGRYPTSKTDYNLYTFGAQPHEISHTEYYEYE